MAAGHMKSTVREQSPHYSAHTAFPLARVMVLTTCSVGLPTLITLISILSHRIVSGECGSSQFD